MGGTSVIKRTLLAVASVVAVAIVVSAQTPPGEAQVLAFFKAYDAAFNAKDMETRKAAQIILNSNTIEDVLEYL